MTRQLIFAIVLLATIAVFALTATRIVRYFMLTRPGFPVKSIGRRLWVTLEVAFGQTKIFREPVTGFLHALVFWGFCVILIGSLEMVIDGLAGTERVLKVLGPVYDVIIASGDIFALLIALAILVFLFRRLFMHVKRFEGPEMKKISHVDAALALTMIFLLMISLLGMNASYIEMTRTHGGEIAGVYPVGMFLASLFSGAGQSTLHFWHELFWWSHIVLIFIFANILPYSKHFHVFMSVPNVFLTRLEPLGKLDNMESITKEVKLMLDPQTAFQAAPEGEAPERFGVKDAQDVIWKNYFDALSCTECGRCTAVCPANITGKKLSPRKIMMDLRARMKEKGPLMLKNGRDFDDGRSLIRSWITEEELWACTTCNACAMECPVNINHPSLIVDMRRYLVMEEGSAPGELKALFSNIENNGAPWQYSPEDRLQWAKEPVPVMADMFAGGEKPEYLFWVGCAGAFDDRYRKVAAAFAKILKHLGTSYAVLGKEESCTGDPARRAGNEMLFQMQALQNIEIFKMYDIKRIITICPHCYNIFKNEYPDLGAEIEVVNYIDFLNENIESGKLKIDRSLLNGMRVTYHDPCYLGRGNQEYEQPRNVLKAMVPEIHEMQRNRSHALCCGAGGGQMFKEAEKGDREVFLDRTGEALETGASVIATACPFCMTMLTDGIKYKNREEDVRNFDIAELVVQSLGI